MKLRFLILLISIIIGSLPSFQMVEASIPETPIFEYMGDGQLVFYNTHTDELLEVIYKGEDGQYIEKGIKDVNYILRCRLASKETDMSLELLELIDHIQDHFNSDEIDIISGYRSPELNNSLRSNGRGVAKRSYHLKGEAVDIRIPGVSTKALRDYAVSLKAGGVGYYLGPDFVHIDVGPVRSW